VWSLFNAGRERVLDYYRTAIEVCGQGDPRLEALAAECRRVLAGLERATGGSPG
jgi:hypothetical protein